LGQLSPKLIPVLRTYLHHLTVSPVKSQDILVREVCGLLWQEISYTEVKDLAVLMSRSPRSIYRSGF